MFTTDPAELTTPDSKSKGVPREYTPDPGNNTPEMYIATPDTQDTLGESLSVRYTTDPKEFIPEKCITTPDIQGESITKEYTQDPERYTEIPDTKNTQGEGILAKYLADPRVCIPEEYTTETGTHIAESIPQYTDHTYITLSIQTLDIPYIPPYTEHTNITLSIKLLIYRRTLSTQTLHLIYKLSTQKYPHPRFPRPRCTRIVKIPLQDRERLQGRLEQSPV